MSNYSNSEKFDLDWIERWARVVNDDKVLPVRSRFFTAKVVIGVDETNYLIEVREGKINRVAEGLTPNDFGYDFGLKASASTWSKFAQQVPPPMFNDVWAMCHPLHQNMVIEGNTLLFWQNVSALTRMLALMRAA